jgi:hypothetical protein
MVVHTCSTSTPEAEGGESQVSGQPELHSKTLPKKQQNQKQNNSQKPTTTNHFDNH